MPFAAPKLRGPLSLNNITSPEILSSSFCSSSGRGRSGASATQTLGMIYGGQEASGYGFNRIETVQIATAGNSIDFGETELLGYSKVASDSHGGLGGF